jgi:magnesium chelatase family protein
LAVVKTAIASWRTILRVPLRRNTMNLSIIKSRALCGMQAPEVTVEVHLANGLPAFTIVGLADTEVREAKDRVRAALQTANFDFPARRITVNLAPADLPKDSGRFDLPIALGILAASGQLPHAAMEGVEFAGELSLSGELRPIHGALAMALAIARAGKRGFFVPAMNAAEAALVQGVPVYGADTLLQVCAHFVRADARIAPHAAVPMAGAARFPDFADVQGQLQARRALEVAAAGGHSVLMLGPPGAGKTMLAKRFPGILPPMSDAEALEAAGVHSLAGGFDPAHWKLRPYRAPHHTASAAALVGGGGMPRPGEISLAHRGVLFLDELAEFSRHVLEVLREPLESGHVTISRAARQARFPARFQLLAAMNPCPCGYAGHPSERCRCSAEAVARYRERISGPLLDRIDMQLEVGALDHASLVDARPAESSSAIAARVQLAHARQLARQGQPNAMLDGAALKAQCTLDADAADLLRVAMQKLNWSARVYHRVLKVARTVADLDGAPRIGVAHAGEAVQYRRSAAMHS